MTLLFGSGLKLLFGLKKSIEMDTSNDEGLLNLRDKIKEWSGYNV